jgi:sporulation protein YunB
VIILLTILVLFCILEFRLNPTILSLAEIQAKWKATEAVHNSILENITKEISYDDMIKIETNTKGEVVYIQANIVVINRIASKAILDAQNALDDLKSEHLSIPIGQITGSRLLAAYGPGIGFRVFPVGTVRLNVKDEFQNAGINQTRHKIYLEVISDMRIVFPFVKSTTQVKTDVAIADTVIVGPVPEHYWGGLTLDIGTFTPAALGVSNL